MKQHIPVYIHGKAIANALSKVYFSSGSMLLPIGGTRRNRFSPSGLQFSSPGRLRDDHFPGDCTARKERSGS